MSHAHAISSHHGERRLSRRQRGQATSDGAGVSLSRIIGTPTLSQVDPFLLLDAFHSDRPEDYIAGFPPHPHRGFETVTYLLAGCMRHEDNAGHAGVIESGGVQWMSAGRGIVHSEMPQQEDGLLFGFQLWVNLPASHKLIEPRYQEIPASGIPETQPAEGVHIRVIAGTTADGTRGAVAELITPVTFLDIRLAPGAAYHAPLTQATALVYPFEGSVSVGGEQAPLPAGTLGQLGPGDELVLANTGEGSRLLLLAGEPLGEPVARHGPFVMNSEAELRQAFADYQAGRF